ncbi:MAG: phage tail protein [Lachnospiraceae bacterium]|nr:phage tail protein [Lachnospiraceae bacterium]
MPKQGLASIGIEVTVGTHEMNYVTDVGDIGGAPSELDATCVKDKMKKTVPGVKDVKSWECTYLFDNSDAESDFRKVKALEDGGKIVPLKVTFPDGTVFATTGYVSTMVSGTKVDELINAKLTVSLQSDWDVTNPMAASES